MAKKTKGADEATPKTLVDSFIHPDTKETVKTYSDGTQTITDRAGVMTEIDLTQTPADETAETTEAPGEATVPQADATVPVRSPEEKAQKQQELLDDAVVIHRLQSAPAREVGVPTLRVRALPHGAGLPEIAYQTRNAAGLDLQAAITEEVRIKPNSFAMIPTGLSLEIPEGYEGQVRPRSGLAAKAGVTVLNTPGTIDADYRGEVKVLLLNTSNNMFRVNRGDRIAQLVLAPVTQMPIVYTTDDLSATERGVGGFGSTGV